MRASSPRRPPNLPKRVSDDVAKEFCQWLYREGQLDTLLMMLEDHHDILAVRILRNVTRTMLTDPTQVGDLYSRQGALREIDRLRRSFEHLGKPQAEFPQEMAELEPVDEELLVPGLDYV